MYFWDNRSYQTLSFLLSALSIIGNNNSKFASTLLISMSWGFLFYSSSSGFSFLFIRTHNKIFENRFFIYYIRIIHTLSKEWSYQQSTAQHSKFLIVWLHYLLIRITPAIIAMSPMSLFMVNFSPRKRMAARQISLQLQYKQRL